MPKKPHIRITLLTKIKNDKNKFLNNHNNKKYKNNLQKIISIEEILKNQNKIKNNQNPKFEEKKKLKIHFQN